MQYDNQKLDKWRSAILALLIVLFAVQFLYSNNRNERGDGGRNVQWSLSDGEETRQTFFPCRIPTGIGERYRFATELGTAPGEDICLAFYETGQAFAVRVNGEERFTSDNTSGQGSFQLISLGRLPEAPSIEVEFTNRVPVVFGQMDFIALGAPITIFRTIVKKISGELILSFLIFIWGFISLLLNKIYYKTAEESDSMKYIGWFMILFALWCLLRTRFFHLITGASNTLYLMENILLLLLPQYLIKASELLAYPMDFFREYQEFYFIYELYLMLTIVLVTLQYTALKTMAAWSILYLAVFFLYIGVFGSFESKITSFFDNDQVILHSSLMKNLKAAILLYGSALGLNLASFETYCLFLIVAFFAMVSLLAELFNQVIMLGRLKEEFDQSKVSLMLSQIRPHFLYNTLNSIRSLIRIQPSEADQLIYNFSRFLRANMTAMDQTMIPFSKELEHIQFYVNIEQTCFPKLKVEYEIEHQDFLIPSLTIQPLVENAIKHGVLKRVEGGTVHIHTYEDHTSWYVEIEDDGVGFDPKQVKNEDGGIGLRNVERRLKYYCHASLSIHSVLNHSTFVRVTIPKTKKEVHHENQNYVGR